MSKWVYKWVSERKDECQGNSATSLTRSCPVILLFVLPLQCILRPPGAKHSRKVAASPMLPCAQACQCISSQQVAIPPSTDAPSNRCHFVKSTARKSGAGLREASSPHSLVHTFLTSSSKNGRALFCRHFLQIEACAHGNTEPKGSTHFHGFICKFTRPRTVTVQLLDMIWLLWWYQLAKTNHHDHSSLTVFSVVSHLLWREERAV